jgi:mono/diheme cytochrome c family protein
MFRIAAALVLVLCLPLPAAAMGHGAEIFKAQGCRGCHSLAGVGGAIGPALDGVGKRLDQGQLRLQLVAPKTVNPASTMPAYTHLSAPDLQALLNYLAGLK